MEKFLWFGSGPKKPTILRKWFLPATKLFLIGFVIPGSSCAATLQDKKGSRTSATNNFWLWLS
jgi:hypothetical protein